jgi:threonine dehydrogenase-like Zn-dependent dehydrogenase
MEDMIRIALSLVVVMLSTCAAAHAAPSSTRPPEPGSVAIIGLGLAGAIALRRRRK